MEPRLAYTHCGPKDDLELQILRPCTSRNIKITGTSHTTSKMRCTGD